MELRRLCICSAFLILAVLSQCTEARHAVQRRAAEDEYDDSFLGDAASDDETQNDADGGDDEEEEVTNATIVTKPMSYNITVGRTVRLECRVSPESGVVVQWSRDGEKYFIGKTKTNNLARFSLDERSTDLVIKDVKPSDSGKYSCKVLQNNPVDIVHTLSILEAPRIVAFSASHYLVKEGSELKLTCDVAGSPQPQIIWSKEEPSGNARLTETFGEFTLNSLTVRNFKRQHAGNYYCYALNDVGTAQANLTISVIGKPAVHVHKTVINTAVGVEAILQCSVHDDANVQIKWYKDGQVVTSGLGQISTSGRHSNLTITPSADNHFGTYTCEATNQYGKHNRSIELVQSPVIENLHSDGGVITWTVHSHQPLEEIVVNLRDLKDGGDWKKLTVELPAERKHKYDLKYEVNSQQISPGKYEAFIKVRNSNSWSSQTDSVAVNPDVPSENIATAAVLGSGNGAHYIESTSTVVISTILMYLLVRMI